MQLDSITIDKFERVEFQAYFAANPQDSPAFNFSNGTTGLGAGRNNGEASNIHVPDHGEIQKVSHAGVGRGNAFGKSKFDGSAIWNYQRGGHRVRLLRRNTSQEKHHEQNVSRCFAEIRLGQ